MKTIQEKPVGKLVEEWVPKNIYNHVRCECGGVIGVYSRRRFTCEKCEKEYSLEELNHDVLLTNEYTGWIFPMKYEVNE